MPARVTRFGIAIPGPGAAAALCLEYVENGKERVRVVSSLTTGRCKTSSGCGLQVKGTNGRAILPFQVKLSVKDIGLETGALVEPVSNRARGAACRFQCRALSWLFYV